MVCQRECSGLQRKYTHSEVLSLAGQRKKERKTGLRTGLQTLALALGLDMGVLAAWRAGQGQRTQMVLGPTRLGLLSPPHPSEKPVISGPLGRGALKGRLCPKEMGKCPPVSLGHTNSGALKT